MIFYIPGLQKPYMYKIHSRTAELAKLQKFSQHSACSKMYGLPQLPCESERGSFSTWHCTCMTVQLYISEFGAVAQIVQKESQPKRPPHNASIETEG